MTKNMFAKIDCMKAGTLKISKRGMDDSGDSSSTGIDRADANGTTSLSSISKVTGRTVPDVITVAGAKAMSCRAF